MSKTNSITARLPTEIFLLDHPPLLPSPLSRPSSPLFNVKVIIEQFSKGMADSELHNLQLNGNKADQSAAFEAPLPDSVNDNDVELESGTLHEDTVDDLMSESQEDKDEEEAPLTRHVDESQNVDSTGNKLTVMDLANDVGGGGWGTSSVNWQFSTFIV